PLPYTPLFRPSYAGFLMLAGALLLAAARVFLMPDAPEVRFDSFRNVISNVLLLQGRGPLVFVQAAAIVLAFLLVFGLVGGWILAGRMLEIGRASCRERV